jgi:hypothetical protein
MEQVKSISFGGREGSSPRIWWLLMMEPSIAHRLFSYFVVIFFNKFISMMRCATIKEKKKGK